MVCVHGGVGAECAGDDRAIWVRARFVGGDLTGVYEFPTWEDDLAAFAAEHDLAALACTE